MIRIIIRTIQLEHYYENHQVVSRPLLPGTRPTPEVQGVASDLPPHSSPAPSGPRFTVGGLAVGAFSHPMQEPPPFSFSCASVLKAVSSVPPVHSPGPVRFLTGRSCPYVQIARAILSGPNVLGPMVTLLLVCNT